MSYNSAVDNFDLLNRYKRSPFPPSYPANLKHFYAPVDDCHGVLSHLLMSVRESLVLGLYGLDDDELAGIIKQKLEHPDIYVQLTLDSSQAGGVHERKLLAEQNYPATSIAVGRSEHGAIMHLKNLVVDGQILVSGSTNWSHSGESLQDNDVVVVHDAVVASVARNRIDAVHANILSKSKTCLVGS